MVYERDFLLFGNDEEETQRAGCAQRNSNVPPQSRSTLRDLAVASADAETPRPEDIQHRLSFIEEHEVTLKANVAKLERDLQSRKEELESLRRDKLQAHLDLKAAEDKSKGVPMPPGPKWLSFVGSTAFNVFSTAIVICNVAVMVLQATQQHSQQAHAKSQLNCHETGTGLKDCVLVPGDLPDDHAALFLLLDNVFLLWYVFELSGHLAYFQRGFLLGELSVVGWNWLDLVIVLSGIVEQWLMPAALPILGTNGHGHTPFLGTMRALRLFRILRMLKVVRAVLFEDLHWVESPMAEAAMSGVIAVNSLVMALELDIEWAGWTWVENIFLVIYSFEMVARVKHQGLHFFDGKNLFWNLSDLLMVLGGMMDLWVMPIARLIQEMIDPASAADHSGGPASTRELLKLLRLMRIVRILRLVRLLRVIKPLYRLLIGVIDSFKAMQWVLVLTLLMLYGCSIFWTSLVGHGLISGGYVSDDSERHFGTVARSLFSLFQLMNGDLGIASSITDTLWGQLLMVGFMVVANWAILAILTAVVSDNMIANSKEAHEEEVEAEKQEMLNQNIKRLKSLFHQFDFNHTGLLEEEEWVILTSDARYVDELCDITKLSPENLRDMFDCLALQDSSTPKKSLRYDAFLAHLNDESETASKWGIVQMMARMRDMEHSLTTRLGNMEQCMEELLEWRQECGGIKRS